MVTNNKNKLGKAIRQRRTRLGLSQETLAQKAGLPFTSFSKIEQGRISNPSVFAVEKIAKSLNTTIDNLIR